MSDTPRTEIFTTDVLEALRNIKAFDGPVKLAYESGPYSISEPTRALLALHKAITAPLQRELASANERIKALEAERDALRGVFVCKSCGARFGLPAKSS